MSQDIPSLSRLVKDRIASLGVSDAARYFGVSIGTISNWSTGKTPPSIDAAQLVLADWIPAPTAPFNTPEELTMWQGKDVMMLLPVYRSFCADTHYTLFANYARYGPDKIGMILEKGTQIHVARNLLVHKGLKTDANNFLFPDDDMIFPCGNADVIRGRYGADLPEPGISMNTISRVMSHPKEMGIVGCLYFGRHRFGVAQCSLGFDQGWEMENEKLRAHKYTQPIPVRWIGTGGMLRIQRWVFDAMKKEIDAGKWPEAKPLSPERPYGFFTPIRADMGEDVSFGLRAAEIGIQTWLDPVLECLHIGEKAFHSRSTENKTI